MGPDGSLDTKTHRLHYRPHHLVHHPAAQPILSCTLCMLWFQAFVDVCCMFRSGTSRIHLPWLIPVSLRRLDQETIKARTATQPRTVIVLCCREVVNTAASRDVLVPVQNPWPTVCYMPVLYSTGELPELMGPAGTSTTVCMPPVSGRVAPGSTR